MDIGAMRFTNVCIHRNTLHTVTYLHTDYTLTASNLLQMGMHGVDNGAMRFIYVCILRNYLHVSTYLHTEYTLTA